MKKALKIIGWTVFGLLAVVVIAVGIACYVIFTPARLTAVAHKAADQFIAAEYQIGEAELTFFSTFPRMGLRANGLLILNPVEGAQNDTVVSASALTATVDVMEFLNRKNLHVHELGLSDAFVNFYIAPDGTTNLSDVFITSPDTTEEDTSAFALPFNELKVDGLRLQARQITFLDEKDTIAASLGKTELAAMANSWDDIFLSLNAHDVCAEMKGENYADSLSLRLNAPMAVNLDSMHFAFRRAELAVNDYALVIGGEADILDSIGINMGIATKNKWQIKPLLALVPDRFTSSLKDLDVDGEASLDATIEGVYSENHMPRVQAHLTLEDGKGAYKPLPYTLRDVVLDATADIRLNEGETSNVEIHKLKAATRHSQFSMLNARINDLMGAMKLNLPLQIDANLPDFAYFLPDSMELTGRTKGTANVNIALDDLTQMRLRKGKITADLNLTDIHYAMDSMIADLPSTRARICIPNTNPSKPKVNWARIDLDAKQLDFSMDTTVSAALGASTVRIEVSDILNKEQDYYASVASERVRGSFEDIQADLRKADLSAHVVGGKRLSAALRTDALDAQMGNELIAKTGSLSLEAAARYKADEKNLFLQWNPRLKINLKQGQLTMPERLPETVFIPSIEFAYSNREMNIENSRIELGHSDLNLRGNVRNIGRWFRHDTILIGELDVVSDHCDANQLLAWFSADEGSEEENPQTGETSNSQTSEASNPQTGEAGLKEPFLVPTDVDLALNTHIREIEIFNQVAKDLKGGIFIQDGNLILDEVGFICRAAKLQLTAMYRSPRRNHLYLGFDYHMIDVDIDELLTMIPNLEQMVPMLSSFKGAAEFHLAAETYLNSQYQPKMSTLRGAAALTAQDLVVLDGETFDKISKLLLFKKKTENRIDSLNAEITVYKNEIDVYPLCVQMDNYMVALGGRHNTNMTFDYDINVLSPIYLGVNVSGNIDDLKIKLAKCKFAQDFRPHWYQKADTQSRELRERIKRSMEKNLRIK